MQPRKSAWCGRALLASVSRGRFRSLLWQQWPGRSRQREPAAHRSADSQVLALSLLVKPTSDCVANSCPSPGTHPLPDDPIKPFSWHVSLGPTPSPARPPTFPITLELPTLVRRGGVASSGGLRVSNPDRAAPAIFARWLKLEIVDRPDTRRTTGHVGQTYELAEVGVLVQRKDRRLAAQHAASGARS